MYVKIPTTGFHFSADQIKWIEESYKGKYMGYWTTQRKDGSWNDMPVDVFYQPNPDVTRGHSHYFGMYRDTFTDETKITDAKSAFSSPLIGLLTDDGEVIVSRYRHDYVSKGDKFIDGGRDYVRSSVVDESMMLITVDRDQFVITPTVEIDDDDGV